MKKESPINFLLKHIRTEQYALIESVFNESEKINLNTNINFKINSKTNQVGSFVGFTFDQNKNVFLKIQVSCHFKIEEKSWKAFANSASTEIIIPKGFLAHLASITVGTARGVLFAKTDGTSFNKYIIPTINVAEIIKKDAKFPLLKA